MKTYTIAEIKELKKLPANSLTKEDLWAAYEDVAMDCIVKVVKSIGYTRVDKVELLGEAYEVMAYSASKWKPGKRNFRSYYYTMLKHRLFRTVWQNYGTHVPKPAHVTTKYDSVQGYSINDAEYQASARAEGRNGALSFLGRVTEAAVESRYGQHTHFDMNPEQLVDAIRFAKRAVSRIENFDKHVKAPERKVLVKRLRRIFYNGETAAEVAETEGVHTNAVQFSLREGRYLLQHLIGLPKASLKSKMVDRVSRGWTRERAATVNKLPKKRGRWERPDQETMRRRLENLAVNKDSREKAAKERKAHRAAVARERYHEKKKAKS